VKSIENDETVYDQESMNELEEMGERLKAQDPLRRKQMTK